jgi:hypothetical protein
MRRMGRGMSARVGILVVGAALVLGACKDIEITGSANSATDYHGSWQGPDVELTLTPGRELPPLGSIPRSVGASVEYRHKGGYMACEWKGLSGRDIVTECGRGAPELIRVDAAPHQRDGVWKMTVAGVEVTRH